MAAGNNTFISDMLGQINLDNVFKNKSERYPSTTAEELKELNPELLLLSSEPFPFQEKHITELKKFLPDTTIKLVDGEMFSWYGSRILHAASYFKKLVDTL